jgi:hypothetical protein
MNFLSENFLCDVIEESRFNREYERRLNDEIYIIDLNEPLKK